MKGNTRDHAKDGVKPPPAYRAGALDPAGGAVLHEARQALLVRMDAVHYYPRLKRVHMWVLENIAESISVSQAADLACLETKSFSRYFRRKVGVTFTEYLNTLRISQAAAMFYAHDCEVSTVAEATGFQNRRTFERWFKRLYHIAPRDFKQAVSPGPR